MPPQDPQIELQDSDGTVRGVVYINSNNEIVIRESAGGNEVVLQSDGTFGPSLSIDHINNDPTEVGNDATSSADNSVAIGNDAASDVTSGVAIGFGANASTNRSIAIGEGATAGGATSGVAIGNGASTGQQALAIGTGASAESFGDIAIGFGGVTVDGGGSVGIGRDVSTGGVAGIGGQLVVEAPDGSRIADADLNNGEVTFYYDEANNNIEFRAKDSGGTVQTGTVSVS